MKIIIATNRKWNEWISKEVEKLISKKISVDLITKKSQLNIEYVKGFNPDYIFLPHWSHLVPKEIYENYKCVIFHMTDLPFGRGGSPLQNLIVRGFKETKLSAIACGEQLDAGPIYLKKDLHLDGTAQNIFERTSVLIKDMILEILTTNPSPAPQEGKVETFKRRTPEESNIADIKDLNKIYDHIRMMDAEGYPLAFLETNDFKIEFSEAELIGEELNAKVKFTKKK